MLQVTPEKVLEKLEVLQKVHTGLRSEGQPIGVDTLCLLFNSPFNSMVSLLNGLEAEQKVSLHRRTNNGRRTGKNNVLYVSLQGKLN